MDLAKFAKMPPENNGGSYLKFTPSENIKIVRFCYKKPEDIQVRRKYYDAATRKVIWDTPEGKWTANLKIAVYSSKSQFEIMTWDRSGKFCTESLLPIFEAAGGDICDMVYKITCTKAGTIDASYSIFPLGEEKSAQYAMPDLTSAEDDGSFINSAEDGDDAPEAVEELPTRKPTAPTANKPVTNPTQSVSTGKPATAEVPRRKKNFWDED